MEDVEGVARRGFRTRLDRGPGQHYPGLILSGLCRANPTPTGRNVVCD